MLHHKCTDCLFFGKFKINHINVILLVFFQINLVYVRLFTETCKQTESSYKRYHIYCACRRNISEDAIKNSAIFVNLALKKADVASVDFARKRATRNEKVAQ